jgi:thiol-disulfide isomerase/thioredoxin
MTPRADGVLKHLSLAASVVLVLTLVSTAGVVFWPRVAHALGIKPKPTVMPYLPGGQIDTPPEWSASSEYTLVVFARASCGACEKAQPYFQQLVEFLGHRAAVVVAGGSNTRDEDAAFARSIGVAESFFKTTPAGLRVRATPTLVLVNRRREILAAWEGVGPPEKQTAIARMIDEKLR